MENCRAELLISGRVQGVGYRYSTARKAEELGLTGWCRNNPDGSVAALFEGEHDRIEAMITWCRQGPGMARVEDIQLVWSAPTGEFSRFSIVG